MKTGPQATYLPLEAAIHVARYALVRNLCRGRRVLDISCGEGYGSFLMAEWGADRVVGIDRSDEAIRSARERFQHRNVTFRQQDVEGAEAIEGEQQFDLIVCLETIEHMQDPRSFLQLLRRVSATGGAILVSCPNDHWYYKDGGDNPWHLRRYTFAEFKALSEDVLGPASNWQIGTALGGFVTMSLGDPAPGRVESRSMVTAVTDAAISVLVPPGDSLAPTPENCSYFLGAWGAAIEGSVTASFPMSMDGCKRPLFGGSSYEELENWRKVLERREEDLSLGLAKRPPTASGSADFGGAGGTDDKIASPLREAGLRLHAAAAENEILRGSLKQVMHDLARAEHRILLLQSSLDERQKATGEAP